MPHEDDIGGRRLVGLEPLAKVVASNLDGAVRLVTRVDLGVDDMGLGESRPQERVDMVGEGLEGLVIAIEAMDVDEDQGAARVRVGDIRDEGL